MASRPTTAIYNQQYRREVPLNRAEEFSRAAGDVFGRDWVKLETGNEQDPGPGPAGIPEKHMNFDFKECFAEHESTRTNPDLYTVQATIYNYSKFILYQLLSIIIGIPLTILWGLLNALVLFLVIWIFGPILKIYLLIIAAFAPSVTGTALLLLTPLVDLSGRCLRQIRVHVQMDGWKKTQNVQTLA